MNSTRKFLNKNCKEADSDKRPLILIGAGGHAKVVAEVVQRERRFEIAGLVDRLPVGTSINGVAVLGDDALLPELYAQGIRHAHVAIGDNRLRARLSQVALELGFELVTLQSPSADVSPTVELSAGIVIMGGVVINAQAKIGDGSIINTRASIDHDCRIGRFVHIAPGSTLAGNVCVGDRTFVGAGVTIIPGVTLGSDVIVGAGACVVRDVPSGQTVVGVPARVKRPA